MIPGAGLRANFRMKQIEIHADSLACFFELEVPCHQVPTWPTDRVGLFKTAVFITAVLLIKQCHSLTNLHLYPSQLTHIDRSLCRNQTSPIVETRFTCLSLANYYFDRTWVP